MVTDIVFSSEEINLGIDDTETIVADVLPEDADNKTLEWSSDSPSIVSVTVDEDTHSATVKGVSEGEAIITAAATDGSGVSAMCNVVVSGSQPYPENANMYVQSVQSYDFCNADGSERDNYYNSIKFKDENDQVIFITFAFGRLTITKSDGNKEIITTSSSIPYIIGSLKDKSYLEVRQSKMDMYFSEVDDYYLNLISEGRGKFIPIDDIRKINFSTNASWINYGLTDVSEQSENSVNIRSASYIVKYGQEFQSAPNTDNEHIIKINRIKNGATLVDYVYNKVREQRYFTKVKFQRTDGTYYYFDGKYGRPIPESDFPTTAPDYEYTYDLDSTT